MRKILQKIKTARGIGYVMECVNCHKPFRIKKWDYDNLRKGTYCSNSCRGEYQRVSLVGKLNPNWKGGKVQIKCMVCGTRVMIKVKDAKRGGKYCSKRCKDYDNSRVVKMNYANNPGLRDKTKHVGDKNGRWLCGKSFEPYTTSFNEHTKNIVKDRDNRVCMICGVNEKDLRESLNVHHIDYDKKNSNINNLISLCNVCHSKTNSNREYWRNYLSSLIVN